MTDRNGPDFSPKASPNGKYIAYLGFTDRVQGYQNTQLLIMDSNGNNKRVLSYNIDSSISSFYWSSDNKGIYFTWIFQRPHK